MRRIGIVLAVALVLAASVAVEAQERPGIERLFNSARTVTVKGIRYDLSRASTFGGGDETAIKFLVTHRDIGGNLVFRDYIQIWDYQETGVDSDDRAAIEGIIVDTVDLLVEKRGYFVPEHPGTVSVFMSDTANGRVFSQDATWTIAQACSSTCTAQTGITSSGNGIAAVGGSDYLLTNLYFEFNTSTIQDNDVIEDAIFTLFSTGLHQGNNSSLTVEARAYDWGGTLTTADWIDLSIATNWTNLPLLAWIPKPTALGAETVITFNSTATFLTEINTTGPTYIVTALNGEYSVNPAPLSNQVGLFKMSEASVPSNERPRLTVTHCFLSPCVAPTPTPTVTPIPPTEIEFTTANLDAFFAVAGIILGLILIGFGEFRREGLYIFAGAIILLAAVIAIGLTWLMILTAIAMFALFYRGMIIWLAIRESNRKED